MANGPARMQSYGAWLATRYKNRKNIVWMLGGDMGTPPHAFNRYARTKKMEEISQYIAQGAKSFLKAEYKIMGIFIVIISIRSGIGA